MAKVKLTKTELKAQSDALKRFQRFLPMLQLKKQQLQAEIAEIVVNIEELKARHTAAEKALESWVSLFSGSADELEQLVSLDRVVTGTNNIAGVTIPIYTGLETQVAEIDLFATPVWVDDAVKTITAMIEFKAERAVLNKQCELITIELNTTSQRVNLFEKVKIPECKENIRIIKIALGDEQTASVTRGKIAKSRCKSPEEEEAA
ncbi:MAG: V-type ATP synthase subunit D [Kiritimatiellae bacterium]|jgi:V/A-type H+-transporting ATPase subunit D|nr:V-type ATP synthase subunit D [Kiritimatiellia bacterium]